MEILPESVASSLVTIQELLSSIFGLLLQLAPLVLLIAGFKYVQKLLIDAFKLKNSKQKKLITFSLVRKEIYQKYENKLDATQLNRKLSKGHGQLPISKIDFTDEVEELMQQGYVPSKTVRRKFNRDIDFIFGNKKASNRGFHINRKSKKLKTSPKTRLPFKFYKLIKNNH